jgi:hypothetical protein
LFTSRSNGSKGGCHRWQATKSAGIFAEHQTKGTARVMPFVHCDDLPRFAIQFTQQKEALNHESLMSS